MTEEDRTAAKLKGYNTYIKFTDGEVIYIKVSNWNDEDSRAEFFEDVEKFLNSNDSDDIFPVSELALRKEHIKYVTSI